MKSYIVRYERDEDGWWVASVKGVSGCHTQGKTIQQSRVRIREALGLFIEDSENVDLIDDIFLPTKARNLVKTVLETRERIEADSVKLQKATLDAARTLTNDIGVSMRDAGDILGLSHQRIHQLTSQGEHKS